MDIFAHYQNEDSGRLARSIASMRYGTSTMVKMQRAPFTELIEAIHLAGKCNILEVLLVNHAENPYTSVDELIGDIQLAMVYHNDHFKKTQFGKSVDKIKVEDLIADHTKRRTEIESSTTIQ